MMLWKAVQILLLVEGLAMSTSTPGNRGDRMQRLDILPTATILEDSHRRRLGLETTLENPPTEWFHPNVKAVYATLHSTNNSTLNHPAYQEFVKYRHLSRYERSLRKEHKMELFPHWNGNYSLLLDTMMSTTFESLSNSTIRRKKKVNRNLGQSLSQDEFSGSLAGGQFNLYQGIPLYQGYGTHYVHLWVGSPIPQRQSVIVDTGSHFTAFPCTGCDECGQEHHTDPYFDPTKSTTFHALSCPSECHEQAVCSIPKPSTDSIVTENSEWVSQQEPERRCHFTQSYTEGSSWKAYQARDIVYAGGPDVLEAANPLDRQYSLHFMFGCLQQEKGLFVTQLADGIMGMSAHETTLPKQLYNQGKLEYNMFAMCFRKELGTSKRGVTAGSMTLGGVSSTLDTSPMLFARNTQSFGWYTVYVQNIYVAKSGGTQFLFDTKESLEHIHRVPINVHQVNSGKGVIVDSGTTDTYLNINVRAAFVKVWKQVTGMDYAHGPIYLSQAQLKRLPTILIQCQAVQSSNTISTLSTSPVIGEVGLLDPQRKSDILLAIPAENYMEYSPTLNLYTSRLYFTESQGGVLGANAMQGHNVLFDWQHGRIGFSQSTCSYDIMANEHHVNYARETYRQGDCVLGPPVLTKSCIESVDVSICEASDHPDNVEIMGTEVWTRIVESPGSDEGSCQVVVTEPSTQQQSQLNPSEFKCTLDGLCTELRSCQVPCLDAMSFHRDTTHDGTTKKIPSNLENQIASSKCGDSFWSACDYNCEQSRLLSVDIGDNSHTCLEVSRSTRDCHVDACGRTDPCIVPFLVHAILVLEAQSTEKISSHGKNTGNLKTSSNSFENWTPDTLETFQKEFTRVAHLPEFSSIAARRRLFNEGDVDVLVVRPWYGDDKPLDESEQTPTTDDRIALGIQLVLQISISNPKAHRIEPDIERRALLQEVGVLWKNFTQPFRPPQQTFTCNPSDLYPLAKDAVELANGILEHQGFGDKLLENLPMYANAKVVSSWTIGTQVYDDIVNYYGPVALTPYIFLFRVLYETALAFFLISLISCIVQYLRAYRHLFSSFARRWCCRKPTRYLALATNDDDDSSIDPSSPSGSMTCSPKEQKLIELSFSRTFSDMHKKNSATTTKRSNSTAYTKAID